MKRTLNKKTALKLVSHTTNEKIDDVISPEKGKVILPDECGDTLWDEVLNEEKKTLAGKEIGEDGLVTNNL